MKSQKGVSLISLTVYIIVFTIVIGVIANITKFFYRNLEDSNENLDPILEYTSFNTFFSDEVNHKGIEVLETGIEENGQNYIVFSNGVQYTFSTKNEAIYKNKVKICKNISNCIFLQSSENGKKIITVNFTSGNYNKIQKYTLRN